MPSPWKVSPAPMRSDSISLLNETSKAVSVFIYRGNRQVWRAWQYPSIK
jgi:hypothetical protein